MLAITRLDSSTADFDTRLKLLLAYESDDDARIEAIVAEVLARVKAEGDAALLDYTRRFDRLAVSSVAELELPKSRLLRLWRRFHPPTGRRWSSPPTASEPTTRSRCKPPGAIAKLTARCWASR